MTKKTIIRWDNESNPQDAGWVWQCGDVCRAICGDVGRDRDASDADLMADAAGDAFFVKGSSIEVSREE